MKTVEPKEIDMTKLSAHDMLEMFRRGEHLTRGSDAYYLSLTTMAALQIGATGCRVETKYGVSEPSADGVVANIHNTFNSP